TDIRKPTGIGSQWSPGIPTTAIGIQTTDTETAFGIREWITKTNNPETTGTGSRWSPGIPKTAVGILRMDTETTDLIQEWIKTNNPVTMDILEKEIFKTNLEKIFFRLRF